MTHPIKGLFPQVLAGTVASTCEDGCKYLRERLHVLAWRMQCTASEMGKRGTEIASPILDKRKGSSDSHMSPYSLKEISAEP